MRRVGLGRVGLAAALAFGCGSHPDLGSDPQWGQGFSARSSDPGDPEEPTSAGQACAMFGGEPFLYPSIDALQARLARRWTGCGDNPAASGGFWPQGFAGIQLDGAGGWQALVRAADGSSEAATAGNAAGTYQVMRLSSDSGEYAPVFILQFQPTGAASPDMGGAHEQWECNLEDAPEILAVTSSTTTDGFRFSSAGP